MATTLNQYYEGNENKFLIHDDRFIHHTLDHWIFCEDQTGNIIDLKNIDYIKRKCEERFGCDDKDQAKGVDLITADGSFDCSLIENSQEEAVGTLNFSEILTALSILNEGGSFIMKMFTAFESYTVSFVYLLNCAFERVEAFKPITSRRGNSEVYYICIKYRKHSENIAAVLAAMRSRFRNENLMLWPIFDRIPQTFQVQHHECCRYFMDKQIRSIQHNLLLYHSEAGWRRPEARGVPDENSWEIFQKAFFTKYSISPLNNEELLMPAYKSTRIKIGMPPDLPKTLQSENVDRKSPEFFKYMYELRQFVAQFEKTLKRNRNRLTSHEAWCKFTLPNGLTKNIPIDESARSYPLELLDIAHGKPVEACRSSMFVYVTYMYAVPKFAPLGQDPLWRGDPRAVLCNGIIEIHYDEHSAKEQISFAEKQANFFTRLLDCLLKTTVGEGELLEAKLCFVNVPFLTHYSVSFLHYLARFVYKELQISNIQTTFEIHLAGLRSSYRGALEVLKSILMEKEAAEGDCLSQPDVSLHRWIKLEELHADILCYPIIFYNNNLLRNNMFSIMEEGWRARGSNSRH